MSFSPGGDSQPEITAAAAVAAAAGGRRAERLPGSDLNFNTFPITAVWAGKITRGKQALFFSCFSGPASALGDKPHVRLFNSLPPVLLTLGFPSILAIQASAHIVPKFGPGLQVKSTLGSLSKDQRLEHVLEGPLPSAPSCRVLSAPVSPAAALRVCPPFSRAPYVLPLNVLSL